MTLEQKIEALQTQIDALKAEVAAKPKEWPKVGDEYFRIDDDGDVRSNIAWTDHFYDRARAAIGNVYRTEAEALREVERRKVLTEYRRLARESWGDGGPDWSNRDQKKWFAMWDYKGRYFETKPAFYMRDIGQVYFSDQPYIEAAIETIGADRLRLLQEV